jgi:hypothetical protein
MAKPIFRSAQREVGLDRPISVQGIPFIFFFLQLSPFLSVFLWFFLVFPSVSGFAGYFFVNFLNFEIIRI